MPQIIRWRIWPFEEFVELWGDLSVDERGLYHHLMIWRMVTVVTNCHQWSPMVTNGHQQWSPSWLNQYLRSRLSLCRSLFATISQRSLASLTSLNLTCKLCHNYHHHCRHSALLCHRADSLFHHHHYCDSKDNVWWWSQSPLGLSRWPWQKRMCSRSPCSPPPLAPGICVNATLIVITITITIVLFTTSI